MSCINNNEISVPSWIDYKLGGKREGQYDLNMSLTSTEHNFLLFEHHKLPQRDLKQNKTKQKTMLWSILLKGDINEESKLTRQTKTQTWKLKMDTHKR